MFSRPRAEDAPGVQYDSEGRINDVLLRNLVGELDAQYLLCGPVSFMAGVQTSLEQHGVSPESIHTESFGPTAA